MFLHAIRRHQWDRGTLPASGGAVPRRLPAAAASRSHGSLAEHVMAQVEDPARLDRWDDPAYS